MRIIHKTNIRVSVYPDTGYPSFFTNDASVFELERIELNAARAIADQIKQCVADYKSVVVSYDTVALCQFCEHQYLDSEPADIVPACCSEALVQFNAIKKMLAD